MLMPGTAGLLEQDKVFPFDKNKMPRHLVVHCSELGSTSVNAVVHYASVMCLLINDGFAKKTAANPAKGLINPEETSRNMFHSLPSHVKKVTLQCTFLECATSGM